MQDRNFLLGAIAVCALAGAGPAAGQWGDPQTDAAMRELGAIVGQAQAQTDANVRAAMADPAVQQRYRSYVQHQQSVGQAPVDFYAYAYGFVASGGYSAQGTQAYLRNESAANARVRQGMADYQAQLDRNRAERDAMQQQAFQNRQEAGNALAGTGTWMTPEGDQVLPFTWERNSYQQYEGRSYYVDHAGQYWWHPADGSGWIAIQPRPMTR